MTPTDSALPANGQSYYPLEFQDSKALFFKPEFFAAHADGTGDNTPGLQAAIDLVEKRHFFGIVFIPEGTYRLAGPVYIWRGIRLIGYGKRRPTFVLGEKTPGYDGPQSQYLFFFCDSRRTAGQTPKDAKNTTFYSGLNNIDIRIEDGNPSAVACRFHVAQLSSLEHMDFHLGQAKAAVEYAGNEIEDCRFFGGDYAIQTPRTSAGWQFLLADCLLDGQRKAAIETDEAGMTLIRCRIRNTPHAVRVHEGRIEELFIKDSIFQNIRDSAIQACQPDDPQTQINVENVQAQNVPAFLRFDQNPPATPAPANIYRISRLCHGLHIGRDHQGQWTRQTQTIADLEPLNDLSPLPDPDYPRLPPQDSWVNIHDLGATGNGKTDDTAAFRQAISRHRTIYIPQGTYALSDTLELGPDTVLIGLHPRKTEFTILPESTAFNDRATARPMIHTPEGGRNIVTGIGFDPGHRPGAIAVKWQAGEESLLDDILFAWGGHGRDPRGFACPGFWIAQNGGGTFKNIWNPYICCEPGLLITDTRTPGRMYLVSIEHHLQVEVQLERVANWRFYALQTEENLGSEKATALCLNDCKNLDFLNLFLYRVRATAQPHPHGITIAASTNITINGLHSFSHGRYPYDNSILLVDQNRFLPDRELAQVRI
jgi:hypothetical protein